MVVSTPPSTLDAISGDDMESDMSLESGIEGSIKRCEALLSMLPMTLGKSFNSDGVHETSNKKLKKARAYLNMNMKNLMEGLEPEWNKNMGLLSNISMSRDISSSPASSWQSYGLHNEISTQSFKTDTDAVVVTRSRTSKGDLDLRRPRRKNKSRYDGGMQSSTFQEAKPGDDTSGRGTSGSSACEEESQSSDPSEDASNRASSDCGESAESAVTDSSSKEVNLEKQSTSSLKSELQNQGEAHVVVQNTAFLASVPTKLRNGQDSLGEETLGEVLVSKKCSPPPHEITISLSQRSQRTSECRLGERAERVASSVAEGNALPQPCLQGEQTQKLSSCSSSASEPTVMERKKILSNANKNAAELKPIAGATGMEIGIHQNNSRAVSQWQTGLPTNYRKADVLPSKEWDSSLKFVESRSKQKGKSSRQKKLKVHTMATVERLSTPKTLAAQRVCYVKTTPEVKRNETPLKESVMRFPTSKISEAQKAYHLQHSRTSPDSRTTPERSIKPRVVMKTEAVSKCSTPFVERLGDIQERINSSKRAKKIQEKEERDLCSFQPNLNTTKYFDVEGYQPIEKRLDCIREQKDKMIIKARDQEAKYLGITFRPELNPNSVRILKERTKSPLTLDINDESGSTSPRNSSNCCTDLSDTRAKASDLSRSAIICPFIPEINANTHQILAGTALEGCDFLTRQQQFLHRIEQRKRLKQQELPSGFTFQPERGNANFILSCSPLFRIDENISAMCERLSNSDNQRRLCIQQQITDNYYSQFAFHPHIDETSRLLGRPPSIETLHLDQSAKQHKDIMRMLAQEEFQRTCTFRPMVRFSNFPAEEAVIEERKKLRLERNKQEDKIRIMRELEELAECTFKPTINPWPPKDVEQTGVTGQQIKGVQRHLELQRLAKQMKIDQAEWEKKVFFAHQNNERPKHQYTIPKPFNFHTGSCNGHCYGSPVNRQNRMVPSTPIHPHLCT